MGLLAGLFVTIIIGSVHTLDLRTASNGDILLVGGARQSQGTVLLRRWDEWGTVCAEHWGKTEAATVCRQLGYEGRSLAAIKAFYKMLDGYIHLRDVKCSKVISRLDKCKVKDYMLQDYCTDGKAVGVDCEPELEAFSDVDVRLVEDVRDDLGAIEIKYHDEWGTICGKPENWGQDLANWACKKLGYSGRDSIALADYFPLGVRKIWQDGLECPTNATSLGQCIVRPWGNAKCKGGKMVGVLCNPEQSEHLTVRLAKGTNETTHGRLELYYSGIWQSLCDDDIQNFHGLDLICRKLGYQWGGYSHEWGSPDGGTFSGTTWSLNINCVGTETLLDFCPRGPWATKHCRTDRLWVQCFNEPHPTRIEIPEEAQFIKDGENVTLTCSAEKGNLPMEFSWLCPPWERGGFTSVNSTSYSAAIRLTVDPTLNNKTCDCRVSTASRWSQSVEKLITVAYGPKQLSMSITKPVKEGQRATATCTVTNSNPAPKLFWYLGERLMRVSTPIEMTKDDLQQRYTFLARNSHLRRQIRCIAYNSFSGMVASGNLSLDVHTIPRMDVKISPSFARDGDSVSFKCQVSSNPPAKVVWKKYPNITFSMASTFTLEPVTKYDAGTYSCVVLTDDGRDVTVAADLQVVDTDFL